MEEITEKCGEGIATYLTTSPHAFSPLEKMRGGDEILGPFSIGCRPTFSSSSSSSSVILLLL